MCLIKPLSYRRFLLTGKHVEAPPDAPDVMIDRDLGLRTGDTLMELMKEGGPALASMLDARWCAGPCR